MTRKHYRSHQRRGAVLLLALLIMSAITASTIGLSVIINSSARQSKNLDDFVIASLTADSGLERSLAVVKAGRQGNTLDEAVAASNFSSPPLTPNNSSFTVAAADSSEPLVVPKLSSGQSVSFDILKTATTPVPPKFLKITGDSNSTGNLDVSWVIIDESGNANYSGRQFATSVTYQTGWIIDLNHQIRTDISNTVSTITPPNLLGYRIQIRAVSGSVSTLTATAWDVLNGKPEQIPSNIAITSTGQAGATSSIKTASILWQLPTSRLFNFVIFTEGPIIPCGSTEADVSKCGI